MRIPKYIHYCWFGNKPLPKQYEEYINTWKEKFPDYEIICWNETNFPIELYKYAQQAYEMKKMAFVSDVARVYALNTMGGVYFDTDVEVLKPFDKLLSEQDAVLGTESEVAIGTGFMAFIPHHEITEAMLEYYKMHRFMDDRGMLSLIPNTHILANLLNEMYGMRPAEYIQSNDRCVVYPQEYFTAYDGYTGKNIITKETYCVHHFENSWSSPMEKVKGRMIKIRNRLLQKLKRRT